MNVNAYHDANLSLPLRPGDAGIEDTLTVMAACCDDAVAGGGPAARLATRIAAASGKGSATQARGVYDALRRLIVFKRDPAGLENVRHPDQLADEIDRHGRTAADCDDVACLGATLLKCAGVRPLFVVASNRPGGQLHHVFFAAAVGPRPLYLDPQERVYARLPAGLTRVEHFAW